MADFVPMILTKLGDIERLQWEIRELLRNIERPLQNIEAQLQARRPDHHLDLHKLLPRLWWGLVVMGLAALQMPLGEAIKIASRLL